MWFFKTSIRSRVFVPALSLLAAAGCGALQNPLEKLQAELQEEKEYAIILKDMREEGNFFPSYYHQYQIARGEQTSVRPFVEVSESFYKKYEPNLGMVLVSKTAAGKVTDTPFPNGYQYVGNPQYGRWRDNGRGGGFWEFYGKYMLMSQVMNWAGFGLSRGHYNDYLTSRTNHRPYFGPKREFGTAGSVTKKMKPDFYARRMAKKARSGSRFQDRINRRTGRAKNTFRSRGFGFGK